MSLHNQDEQVLESVSRLPPKGGDALPALYITCFGRFQVQRFEQAVELCSNRSGQAILRYLIAQSGYRARRDTLMDVLWREDTPEVARRKLQVAVSALRRSLNGGYTSDAGGGYILCQGQFYHMPETISMFRAALDTSPVDRAKIEQE